MFGAILKAINSFFLKGMTFCRNIYVKKVMKLLAFIFEQPSQTSEYFCHLFRSLIGHACVDFWIILTPQVCGGRGETSVFFSLENPMLAPNCLKMLSADDK